MNIILLCINITVLFLTVRLIGNRTHFHTILENYCSYTKHPKLHSTMPHANTRLLLVQLFPNCTQMQAIDYTKSSGTYLAEVATISTPAKNETAEPS